MGRFLQVDPIRFFGSSNSYNYVQNNSINSIDPYGLYIWQAQYWANRSIRGNWLNRAFSTVMGVFAAMVPDVATVEIRGLVGVGYGRSAGTGYLINSSEGSLTPYYTTGILRGTPILGLGISFSIAWSDLPSPSPLEYMGHFHEVYAGYDFVSIGMYGNQNWFGLAGGFGHDWRFPAYINYQFVNYRMYGPEACAKK